MRKIVVLMGSPRKNGNTQMLAQAFIKGAKEASHEVEMVSVVDYQVNGCLGCNYCLNHAGTCVQKDDMDKIFDKLNEADMLVFATPVYFFNMSAQLKCVIDRLFTMVVKPLQVSSTALLVALEGNKEKDYAPTLLTYQTMIDYINWQDEGTVVASNVLNKGDIVNHKALDEAYELGRNL